MVAVFGLEGRDKLLDTLALGSVQNGQGPIIQRVVAHELGCFAEGFETVRSYQPLREAPKDAILVIELGEQKRVSEFLGPTQLFVTSGESKVAVAGDADRRLTNVHGQVAEKVVERAYQSSHG